MRRLPLADSTPYGPACPYYEGTMLSESALKLLRLHIEQDGIRVDDSNREAHRELAAAGIMYPVSTFARGPEAYFRFTKEGWERREELLSWAKESA
jgi:hypothetical protein